MATATELNLGIRRMIYSLSTPEFRNFERSGQSYKCVRDKYEYQGTVYNAGDVIPYDVAGTSYGNLPNSNGTSTRAGLIRPRNRCDYVPTQTETPSPGFADRRSESR
jgi:hypothetical protein